jgi:uncharacterized protein (DUF1778 family)
MSTNEELRAKRDHLIGVRVSEQQAQAIARAADQGGLNTSSFLRRLVTLQAFERELAVRPHDANTPALVDELKLWEAWLAEPSETEDEENEPNDTAD